MQANIDNKTIRQSKKKKSINATKKVLNEWFKSINYEKLKSGNSISKSL